MAVERNNSAHDFETMLSLHLQRRGGRRVSCEGFDPDRASAFVEGVLASVEASRYEDHLSGCGTCRQAVIDLKRMSLAAEPERQPHLVTPEATKVGWLKALAESVRVAPFRWATAAAGACAVVFALMSVISLRQPLNSRTEPEASRIVSIPSQAAAPAPEAREEQLSREVKPSPSAPTLQAKRNEMAATSDRIAGLPATEQPELPKRLNEQQFALSVGALPPTSPPALALADSIAPPNPGSASSLRMRSEQRAAAFERPGSDKAEQGADRARASKATADFLPQPDALMKKLAKPTPTPNIEDENFRAFTRTVQDKTFRQERGMWIDQEFKVQNFFLRIEVVRGSPEYEKLIEEIPPLKVFFDLAPVKVVWQMKVYIVK